MRAKAMTASCHTVLRDSFVDSVLLLAATRAMLDADGVDWATAVMATPANRAVLASEGFGGADLDAASANDLVMAVRAGSEEACASGLAQGRARLVEEQPAAGPQSAGRPARTIEEAVAG